MEKGNEQNGPPAKRGANGGGAPQIAGVGHMVGMQPTYDWQAAFQAFYGQGQRQPSGPGGTTAPMPPYPWGGQSMPPAMFGGNFPGAPFPGAYGPYAPNPGAALDGSASRAKAWLPPQLTAQMSGGSSLKRDQGSLGSLGNLLKSNGESPSRSSGASDSTQEEEKVKGDTDVSPSLQILRKRSFEHMGLDAVAAGGTGLPPYMGRGAFASAPSLDPSTAPSKGNLVARTSAMQSPLQRNDSATGDETWLQMGQGTDSGVGDGRLDLDDKEVRKQRRKQSNRESARRSRLRKQAECEELSGRVDHLSNENLALRAELVRLGEQCTQLASDNRVLQDELLRVRNRGQAWRAAEGANTRLGPNSGGGQPRREKPPLRPASQERAMHRSPAEQDPPKGAGKADSHSNENGQVRQSGGNNAEQAASPRTSPMEEEARASTDKQAAPGSAEQGSRSSQNEAKPLPPVEVREGKGLGTEGPNAQQGPSTPGPTLTSNASSPGRDKLPAWLPDGKENGHREPPSDGGKQGDDRKGEETIERRSSESQQPMAAQIPSLKNMV